ncbi:MAG: MotA/TolQ/ExbB proton channel family protein [Pseudomonadota bacterium]|nr:MotA/TolQ/ExbB proton channel family protein [Pseudomonadota bacterium]
MLDLFQAGGILMLPIGFCSVIALAICLERWWSLRRAQVLPEPLLARMGDTNGWPSNAAALTELGNTSELGYLLAVGLANRGVPRDEFAQAMQGALDVTAHNLERHLTRLGVVASICPLLGILGTVVGLIDVFDQLFAAGQTDSQLLAGGISTALITTAAGLSVAIPALICHRALLRHVDALMVEMEAVSNSFLEQLRQAD